MPSKDDFRATLEKIFEVARDMRLTGVVVKSGNLHRFVGGYPGANHRMPMCCDAMRQMMREGDQILSEPPSGKGASLEILFRLN